MNYKKFAGIQYIGIAGTTAPCIDAIARFIHFGDKIITAKIFSNFDGNFGAHCLLLDINNGHYAQ